MVTVSKGPYYWDVRGSASERQPFADEYANEMPPGSTYLVTEGNHDLYLWNAKDKKWELF